MKTLNTSVETILAPIWAQPCWRTCRSSAYATFVQRHSECTYRHWNQYQHFGFKWTWLIRIIPVPVFTHMDMYTRQFFLNHKCQIQSSLTCLSAYRRYICQSNRWRNQAIHLHNRAIPAEPERILSRHCFACQFSTDITHRNTIPPFFKQNITDSSHNWDVDGYLPWRKPWTETPSSPWFSTKLWQAEGQVRSTTHNIMPRLIMMQLCWMSKNHEDRIRAKS